MKRFIFFVLVGLLIKSCQSNYFLYGNKYEPIRIKELFSFGQRGSGPGKFKLIDPVISDREGNIYVGDKQGFIHKFSSSGSFTKKIGSQGSGKGQFCDEVKGLAIDSKDRLLAVDMINCKINIFNLEGDFVASFGRSGYKEGEFIEPSGLTVDEQDNIYVVDSKTLYVSKFDSNFRFVMRFGGSPARYYPEMTYIDSKMAKSEGGEIEGGESIAYHGGRLFVCDEVASKIKVYDTNGNYLTSIGSEGIGFGNFLDEVEGISIDGDGYIYAVNESKGKWGSVNVYDKNYRPVLQFSSLEGYLVSPDGLWVDSENARLYITDQGNWKIRVFDLNEIKKHFKVYED